MLNPQLLAVCPTAASGAGRYGEAKARPKSWCATASAAQPADQEQYAEDDERCRRAVPDRLLGQPTAELQPDDDRERVRGNHADGRSEPRAEQAVRRGERDRREHRLVAELGEEERARDREDRVGGRAV